VEIQSIDKLYAKKERKMPSILHTAGAKVCLNDSKSDF
jgi:hypothetical protein